MAARYYLEKLAKHLQQDSMLKGFHSLINGLIDEEKNSGERSTDVERRIWPTLIELQPSIGQAVDRVAEKANTKCQEVLQSLIKSRFRGKRVGKGFLNI